MTKILQRGKEMRLVCGRCDCEMTKMYGYFSTRPMYWICPNYKYKVKNAEYEE